MNHSYSNEDHLQHLGRINSLLINRDIALFNSLRSIPVRRKHYEASIETKLKSSVSSKSVVCRVPCECEELVSETKRTVEETRSREFRT